MPEIIFKGTLMGFSSGLLTMFAINPEKEPNPWILAAEVICIIGWTTLLILKEIKKK